MICWFCWTEDCASETDYALHGISYATIIRVKQFWCWVTIFFIWLSYVRERIDPCKSLQREYNILKTSIFNACCVVKIKSTPISTLSLARPHRPISFRKSKPLLIQVSIFLSVSPLDSVLFTLCQEESQTPAINPFRHSNKYNLKVM